MTVITNETRNDLLDAVVVGGSQAGLAMALLGFVGDDAAYLAGLITSNASSPDVTNKESVHA
jgi:hypothetical protein